MKKILLSAAVVFALGTTAQAQDMSFGVKVVLTLQTLVETK